MSASSLRSSSMPGAILEEAARWHERLQRAHVTDETREAFARWHEVAEHARAYSSVERAWSIARAAAEEPGVLALRHEAALRLMRRSRRGFVARLTAVAAATLLVLAAVLVMDGMPRQLAGLVSMDRGREQFGPLPAGRYVTETGERLVVSLADGSRLTLNTRTEVSVAFTAEERRIRLERGQALFEVAKDANRPFVVEVEDRRLIALGTAFDVRIEGERVQVTMLEGTVAVERTASPGRPAEVRNRPGATARVATITAGDQLMMDGEQVSRVRVADPQRVTSWQRGQVIFENARLADAVAELNRYSDTQIRLADPHLGELRLSGAFVTGRPQVFTEAVTTYFPIDIARTSDEAIVLAPRR